MKELKHKEFLKDNCVKMSYHTHFYDRQWIKFSAANKFWECRSIEQTTLSTLQNLLIRLSEPTLQKYGPNILSD